MRVRRLVHGKCVEKALAHLNCGCDALKLRLPVVRQCEALSHDINFPFDPMVDLDLQGIGLNRTHGELAELFRQLRERPPHILAIEMD